MANFTGSARSNYFRVKDVENFKSWALNISNIGFWEKEGTFAIYSDDPDTGCWPSSALNPETDDHEEIDLVAELADHLQDGEVAVLMQAGAEKLRYIGAYATAVNHKGETVDVSLNQIYQLAMDKFGVDPSRAEY
ncbi:MAG: hypothetical protein PHV02_03145 [Rhodocyclaceae bacterium]|nr:hypothetical protein [Rhodocyclaceae bacterium]